MGDFVAGRAPDNTFPPLLVGADGRAITSAVPTGTRVLRNMQPNVQASANFSNAKEFVSLTSGCRAFRITALAVPTGEAIVCAFSTTAADSVAIKALIDSITTTTTGKWDVIDGTAFSNVIVLLPSMLASGWIVPDSAALIKSIGLQQTSGALTQVMLETVE